MIARLIFPSILFFISLQTQASPLHVVIDPGHGGIDAGAVYGNAKESEIALKVSLQLKALMEKDKDFKVSLTREADQNLSLEDRVQKAEKQKADIFLSLHLNASKDLRAKGVEFYFQNNLPADEESLYLANLENKMSQEQSEDSLSKKTDVLAIVEDLKRNTKMHQSHQLSQKLLQAWSQNQRSGSRIIRQAPFYVITKTKIPSVLVELGFISNEAEAQKLLQSSYQKQLAERIFTGLQDFKEMVDKAELRSLH